MKTEEKGKNLPGKIEEIDMARILYGVWNEEITDNRNKCFIEIEELKEFDQADEFNPGNPVKAFLGAKGFFVFDKNTNILDAAYQYAATAARESCGKCTPCRVGTEVLASKLDALSRGEIGTDAIDEILTLAEHVESTSMCGLGQTSTEPLIAMIRYFREEFEAGIGGHDETGKQAYTDYVTAPCIEQCPSRVDIPRYIEYVKDSKFHRSIGVILKKYPMAATCGRVCVRFCEAACRRSRVDEPVGIKVLKRFVADKERYVTDQWFNQDLIAEKKGDFLKVAVVGAGPAGISAAYHLLLKGYAVDVYESLNEPGGMAGVGIPKYRLPKDEILNKEVSIIEALGGRIHYRKKMGRDFSLNDLIGQGYKAVFIGVGAHKGKKLKVAGEDDSLQGYISGVKFLLYINQHVLNEQNGEFPVKLGKKLLVMGGGNVAMDCARSALRMGVKEVHVAYRRAEEQMPADVEEIHAAKKEGIHFHFLSQPVRVIAEKGRVTGIEFVEMALGEMDSSGRRGVTPRPGSEFIIDADTAVVAIGQEVDTSFLNEDDGMELDHWECLKTDEHLATTRKGVFAGGDCVLGPATLIQAMAQGEKAARSIDEYLTYGRPQFDSDRRMSQIVNCVSRHVDDDVIQPVKNQYRVHVEELEPEKRKEIFAEVEKTITAEEAAREADRCLRCYRIYSVITDH